MQQESCNKNGEFISMTTLTTCNKFKLQPHTYNYTRYYYDYKQDAKKIYWGKKVDYERE